MKFCLGLLDEERPFVQFSLDEGNLAQVFTLTLNFNLAGACLAEALSRPGQPVLCLAFALRHLRKVLLRELNCECVRDPLLGVPQAPSS